MTPDHFIRPFPTLPHKVQCILERKYKIVQAGRLYCRTYNTHPPKAQTPDSLLWASFQQIEREGKLEKEALPSSGTMSQPKIGLIILLILSGDYIKQGLTAELARLIQKVYEVDV